MRVMHQLVMFMTRRCPVCFRLNIELRKLEARGKAHIIRVDIDATRSGSLFDRYKFFVNNVLRGDERIPVLLLDETKWFIPKKTSRIGEPLPRSELIEEAVKETVRKLEEELKKDIELAPPPTHERLLFSELMKRGIWAGGV